MKKLITILTVFLTFGLVANSQVFIKTGVARSNSVTYESLEIGGTDGKNNLSGVVESFNSLNDLTFKKDRQYFAGIKYGRNIPIDKKLDFVLSTALLVHLNEDASMAVEPGLGLQYNVNKDFSFVGTFSSPIYEKSIFQSTKPYESLQLKGEVGIKVIL